MKRYLVFKGNQYYPHGGMEDFLIDVESVDLGKLKIEEKLKSEFEEQKEYWLNYDEFKRDRDDFEWAHIYDTVKMDIVWEKQLNIA